MNSSSSINLKNLIESKSLESNSLNLGPLTNSNFNDSFNIIIMKMKILSIVPYLIYLQ